MDIQQLKEEIEKRTGVPSSILHGETAGAIIAQAEALIDYKREIENQRQKNTTEQFIDWFSACMGEYGAEDKSDTSLSADGGATDVTEYNYPTLQLPFYHYSRGLICHPRKEHR